MQPHLDPFNPYGFANFAPKQEVITFNGRQGAENFKMAPNSSVLALDVNEPVLYALATDSSGVKTINRYMITPIQEVKEPTLSEVMAKLNEMEAKYESHFRAIDNKYSEESGPQYPKKRNNEKS